MSFRTKTAAYFSSLMENKTPTGADRLMLGLLRCGSAVYERCVTSRYESYRDHPEKTNHLPAQVISLGNITVGGTGKTPLACYLARLLTDRGLRVALLNRGYRSRMEHQTGVMSDGQTVLLTPEEGGDEAYLKARLLPGVPVIVGRDRTAAGRIAVERFGTQVLILDDGYQHWQLARDLDIVLVDATNPFGNGHVLPGGILREPLAHLDRAGLFVITKADGVDEAALEAIVQVLKRYNDRAPVIRASHKAGWCVPFDVWYGDRRQEYAAYGRGRQQRALTVSALGNPASFEETVRSFGFDLVDTMRYDDHHQYTGADIDSMVQQAQAAQAIIITTEKDAVKFPAAYVTECHAPVYVLGIDIEIVSGQEQLQAVLEPLVGGLL